MAHNCLHHLVECCIIISDVASRRHLYSASRYHLVMPWHSLSINGRRALDFCCCWPCCLELTEWLRDRTLSTDNFRRLKTHLFSVH